MKQLINRKLYDTDKADRIAQYCPIPDPREFNFIKEELYKTEDGEYFLAAKGGPQTKWAEKNGAYRSGSEEIVPVTDEEAVDWCEERQIDGEIILNEFEHLIET